MSAPFAMEWRGLVFGAALAGAGLYGLLRANHAARRNRADAESGGMARDTRFGRPPTSPARIRFAGALALLAGIALLWLSSPVSPFELAGKTSR